MIIAFTDYDNDEVTTHLAAYAQVFIHEAGSLVSEVLAPPTDSFSSNIQTVLTNSQADLFFFGHGEEHPPSLLGQDRLSALDSNYSHLLRDRLICAVCCHSIAALSNAVTNYNATVLGYDGELGLIFKEPYSSMIRDCILAGPRELIHGGTAGAAYKAIQQKFSDLARELIMKSIEDHVVASYMEDNAALISLRGDLDKRIV